MATIGLKKFHYAPLTKDDATGVTYSTPVNIPGAITGTVKPDSKSATLYADDGPSDTANALGEITVEVETKELPLKDQAALLGHTITGGVMVASEDDEAPYVAIMFQGRKANGKIRFVKLLKGKFSEPDVDMETKKDGVNFKTEKITGKFVCRVYDGQWKRVADSDATDYTEDIGTNWYAYVEKTS